MICPFRIIDRFEYSNIDGKGIYPDSKTEEYPECYEEECPLYKWDVDERDYVCKRALLLGTGDIDGLEGSEQ